MLHLARFLVASLRFCAKILAEQWLAYGLAKRSVLKL